MSNQNRPKIEQISTGISNLDAILGGGIPKNSIVVFAGPPGSAKTILSQQIGFHNAAQNKKILFIQTLSEPTIKTLLYLQQFDYFDENKLHNSVVFVDLGAILKSEGLLAASKMILEQVKKEGPDITIIDSFRVFDDLANSNEELRKFTYQLLVSLIAWETTILLLGEFGPDDIRTNPLFSVVDGIIMVSQEEISGEQLRFLQVSKLRGSAHNLDKHPFRISSQGVEVYAPRVTLQLSHRNDSEQLTQARIKTGVPVLDQLIGPGILEGSTVLVSGRAGSGKTILLLEFLYKGAIEFGEKGLFVTFQETKENLVATARELGWDLQALIDKGTIDIYSIPQPEVLVEANLLVIQRLLQAKGYKRLALDSVSSFLSKITSPEIYREKFYQITTIVSTANAICLMSSIQSYQLKASSLFPDEETLVDGSIFMHVKKTLLKRRRYIEIRKLRKTAHVLDLQHFTIGEGGIIAGSSLTDSSNEVHKTIVKENK